MLNFADKYCWLCVSYLLSILSISEMIETSLLWIPRVTVTNEDVVNNLQHINSGKNDQLVIYEQNILLDVKHN